MPRYKKILVLLDLSPASEQVAVAGRDLAQQFGAELVVLHVVEFIAMEPMGESLMPSVDIDTALIGRARDKLDSLITRVNIERSTVRIESGNTKAEILRVAQEVSADLIVLGSRERHGLGILVNLIEDTVLHAAHCDVLAIRLKTSAA